MTEFPVLQNLVDKWLVPEDVFLNERDVCDLEMLMNGAFAPLKGYLGLADYKSVCDKMRLADGSLWPMPIVLPQALKLLVPREVENVAPQVIRLRDKTNAILCSLRLTDIYVPDLDAQKLSVLGTNDKNHPYAKHLDAEHANCAYLGGELVNCGEIVHFDFTNYRIPPAAVKQHIQDNKWEVVVGFQTRNPMHGSHFALTVEALREAAEIEGKEAHLLLTPAVGPTQKGDVDYPVRVRCYERILTHYEATPMLILLPLAMRMAGPREALWHALIRHNYGCTHFVVGRDHAGPSTRKSDGKTFYGPYEAHELLKSLEGEIGIKPIFGRSMVYVPQPVDKYMREEDVPEGAKPESISGTAFRRMLLDREPVPEWFSFPDVVAALHAAYKPFHKQGLVVYFTGLPCAGKSTLANALEALFVENAQEERKVTLLDADVIRTHLSSGLGFSRPDRQTNVRRIGYVASEITKHGGICLVANIAPYEEDRRFNREMVESVGANYIEVYVSTPLAVCEQRDVKELYKKARLGQIKQFTGISDNYEVPANADIVVDSSTDLRAKVASVKQFLLEHKFIL